MVERRCRTFLITFSPFYFIPRYLDTFTIPDEISQSSLAAGRHVLAQSALGLNAWRIQGVTQAQKIRCLLEAVLNNPQDRAPFCQLSFPLPIRIS